MPADAASDPASLAGLLDQIENLSISGGGRLSLSDVSAELRQMSLTSGGDREGPGPPVCSDVRVPPAGEDGTAAERAGTELGQMRLTSGGGRRNSECGVSPPGAPSGS